MKLLRYGKTGYEKPGLLDRLDQIRDLSGVISNIDAETITPASLKKLRAIDPESLPIVKGKPRLGVPYTGISKFVAVGLNYSDHAAEAGMAVPTEPILFSKTTTSIIGPNDPVVLPRDATKGDWEVEFAIVIGSTARYVAEDKALDYVAGYCVTNDVSERDFQLERGTQWDRGKGCDTFGPIGPYLVTTDEIPNPQALDMWLDLNGQRMQTGNTRTMIFGAAFLVSYISRFMTLLPGDIIATGTPPGVGLGKKPQMFLKPGDVMTLGVSGLGEQRQEVRAFTPEFWKNYP
ncbi:MAG: 2-hydroxyhepta-2,4-diene,7-dioate isomerase [Betaproteobacteria bacterium]|nr:2-hydroxyhepta-2,4-diene,7-dioate isomerase [Betaproteobacteria bacterium]